MHSLNQDHNPPPLLRIGGVRKAFPGALAVANADLEVRAGEVHALVGENGAGKSTLIKVLTGAHAADRGRVEFAGRPLALPHPAAGVRAGIAAIYQELSLIPGLTVRENLFLGRERTRAGWLDAAGERRRSQAVLARLGVAIGPETRCGDLEIAQQQIVEIARMLVHEARLLILDEPTAALTPREVDRLFSVLADLRRRGLGLLLITHRLDEVFRLADRITVMRDGRTLGTWHASELNREQLIELMVGRPLDQEFPKQAATRGAAKLEVCGLAGGRVRGVSFTVRAGEVLGLAGLVGAGRTELARLIFGADRPTAGSILVAGRRVNIRSPREAIKHGICLLTEDRKEQGLVLGLPAQENFALPSLDRWSRWGWLDHERESVAFQLHIANLRIRLASPAQPAGQLSGGNQQKLLVARWLERDAQVVLFDEPTRGVDVGAKYELYLLINELAARGKAVVMISSELPEILGMSDRILVMHDGKLTGEIEDVASVTAEDVLTLAVS